MKPKAPSEIELCTVPLSFIVDKDNEIAELKAHINSLRGYLGTIKNSVVGNGLNRWDSPHNIMRTRWLIADNCDYGLEKYLQNRNQLFT